MSHVIKFWREKWPSITQAAEVPSLPPTVGLFSKSIDFVVATSGSWKRFCKTLSYTIQCLYRQHLTYRQYTHPLHWMVAYIHVPWSVDVHTDECVPLHTTCHQPPQPLAVLVHSFYVVSLSVAHFAFFTSIFGKELPTSVPKVLKIMQ